MNRLLRIAGILFLAALALLALVPAPLSRGRLATHGFSHALLHTAVFFVAFHLIAAGSATTRKSISLALILLAFGIVLEYLQTRRYGIWLEYRDILANAAGILLGCLTRLLRIPAIRSMRVTSHR